MKRARNLLIKMHKAAFIMLLLFSAILCGKRAAAAEQVSPPKIEEMPPFDFEKDSGLKDTRDPFTIAKVTKPINDVELPDQLKTPTMPASVVEGKRKAAESYYASAEQCLLENKAAASMTQCDRGIDELKDVTIITDYPTLQLVRENLLRLRKAAERKQQRQDVEQEFNRLNLKVSGIIAAKRSQAISNGKIVSKGDLVSPSADNSNVVIVEEILPEQVIVLFRGYKMSLTLTEISR